MSLGFIVHLMCLISIYSLLAVSLNLALGFTGLINLGHVAIYGVGAYTSALLSLQGVPILISILLGGVVAAIFSYFLMILTVRLKGDYLAMATLSFSFVIYSLFLNLDWLTGGPIGVVGIDRPLGFDSNLNYLGFSFLVSTIGIYLIYRIAHSSFGQLFQAVRDDEILLRTMGKNTFILKIKAMFISAFFAGIAGGLYAHYIGYIHPETFHLGEIIILLTIVIVGGLASIKGSLVATLIILLLPELIRLLQIPQSILGPMRQIIYAVVLITILMFHSKGIFGKVDLE